MVKNGHTPAAHWEQLEPRRLLSGNGLAAQYFSDASLGHLAVSRVDATVNFNWGRKSPDRSIPPDQFSARWAGVVAPKFTDKYTFSTASDDGVRLWVNDTLLIDNWQASRHALHNQGKIVLQQGVQYDLRMEYFKDPGRAMVKLFWQSRHQRRQIVPTKSLFLRSPGPTLAPPPPAAVQWSAPITITHGGTYTGNWQSLNAKVPAVQIDTSEPVVIENSQVSGRGDLIATAYNGAHLIVRNTTGTALNPMVRGRYPGRFITAGQFASVDIENNTLVGTSGIFLAHFQGDGTAQNTVTVLRNSATDIDGRFSDGAGGFMSGASDYYDVQFVQLDDVHHLAGAQIAWNQVINHPGQSRVEDNISIYKSSGTADSPILIHDNYIQGAYPAVPATQDYSGGGILLGDGSATSADDDSGFVKVFNNQIISTTNYGIGIPAGHDDSVYNNRVVSSGFLADGAYIAAQNVGIYIWNSQKDPYFANDGAYDNVVGWVRKSDTGKPMRADTWMPNATRSSGNTSIGATVSQATEATELTLWTQKLLTTGIVVGAAT
jgi:hypothetical protein